jgi:uncharacterized membrane protein YcfT
MPDPSPSAPQGAAPRPRLAWIDTARGLTMIMVVLLHADVLAQAMGRPVLAVTLFDHALYPLRMPMFFLVSGLLAAGLLRRAGAGEVLRRRVAHYAWLYALWWAVVAAAHAWPLREVGPPGLRDYYAAPEGPLQALTVAWNNVWFLYALMLFFALALAIRRLPVTAQAAVALAAMAVGGADWGEAIGLPVLDRFYHFPYFLAGVLAAEQLRGAGGVVPRLGRPWVWLPLAALWLALAAGSHMLRVLGDPALGGRPDVATVAAVVAAISLAALPAGLGFAAWLADRWPWLAAPLQVIGRNTLVIYVLHTLALRPLMAWAPWDAVPGVVLLPLVTLAAVGLSLLVGRPLERALPFLFALPAPFSRRRRDAAAEPAARAG